MIGLLKHLQNRKHKYIMQHTSVIVWDLDGTLFRNASFGRTLQETYITLIAEHNNVKREVAQAEFKQYLTTHSATWSQTVSALTGKNEKKLIYQAEQRLDRSHFVKKDKHLLSLFLQIHALGKRQVIFSNSFRRPIRLTLMSLGCSSELLSTFKIYSLSNVLHPKPHPDGFSKIIRESNASPSSHLMVGDHEITDIQPAKKMGMKTCLVYGKTSGADIHLNSVYDITALL